MLRRLQALYLRYAAVHEDRLRGVALGPVGRRIGQVERVVRRGDWVEVTGWAAADSVRITWPGGEISVPPDIHRSDVAARTGIAPDAGFEAQVPATARPLTLHVGAVSAPLSHPSEPAPASAHRRLRRAFLRNLGRATPAFARYFWAPTPLTKTAVKRALGLEVTARGHLIDPTWFTASTPKTMPATEITIVLPIHNALPYLKKCLARVAAHTDVPWHLIAINDASTDSDLSPWLADWAAERADQVTLLSTPRNLGFVGAVNVGLEAAKARGGDGAVVLLNTDAMVPARWASRLIAPLSDPSVASVTPMSNAAELLSVPAIGPGFPLQDGDVDAIDAVAATLAESRPDLPTGVGFCMAMARSWLAQVPRLDPAFGRGYGEEVDWCQKTKAKGARHLCQPRVFVEHEGGQSFGSDEKQSQLRRSNALISSRYPRFDATVQRFIAEDPLATPRLALAVALAARHGAKRLPVYLAHSFGGGAEVALQMEVDTVGAAVILRVGGPRRWQVDVRVGGQLVAGQTDDLATIAKLLAPVPALDLIYSCGVGDPDPVTLPEALLSLKREGRDDAIALRLHDYFPVSPAYTLLEDGAFKGVPAEANTRPSHTTRRPDGTSVSLAQWRAAWGTLIAAAGEVTAFSASSAALFLQAYPGAPVHLRPHQLPTPVRAAHPARAAAIAVLGNVNHQKGAHVLRDIALRHPDQSFVVIGNADSAITLPRNVTLHGAYRREEVADLAERFGVTGWLVPAIWPETFSFTTHEALGTGLPVAGFALGAQGEALAAAKNGITVQLEPEGLPATLLFEALKAHIRAAKDAGELPQA